MTPWQLHCPQCAGLFQIDPSYAGQAVGCPLCGAVVMLPPVQPSPSSPPPPPLSEPWQLACPWCRGAFLVGPEMAGQQVGCPHCAQAVAVPSASPSLGPPPTLAPPAPPVSAPAPPISSPPVSPAEPTNSALKDDPRYPPKRTPASAPPAPKPAPAPAPPRKPPAAPPAPPTPVAPSTVVMEESLLPPGTAGNAGNVPLQQVALPRQPAAPLPPKQPDRKPEGTIFLPTEDGKLVAIHEPVKTVGVGRDVRELHVLSPKEKNQRRRIKNLVVYAFGLIVLVVVFLVLANL